MPLTEPTQAFNRRKPAVYSDRPTTANDPDVTPEVKGITDQDSIADWDAAISLDQRRVRSVDDTFWENHRTNAESVCAYGGRTKVVEESLRRYDVNSGRSGRRCTAESLTKSLEEKLVGAGRIGFGVSRGEAAGARGGVRHNAV